LRDLRFVPAGVAEQEVSGDDDDGQQGHQGHGRIRAVGGHVLVQLAKEESPAEDCGTGPDQHNGHIQPDGQAQQESNHGADNRTGHPEREPDEKEQPDDPVLLDFLFVPLGGLVRTLHYPLEPFENQQMLPAKDEQRIKNKHEDCLDDDADGNDRAVAEAEGVSEGHAGGPAEHDVDGRHADQNLGLLGRPEQLDSEPCRVDECQRDADKQQAAL